MSSTPLSRQNARPGTYLSELGGLPPVKGGQTPGLSAAAGGKPQGSLNDAFNWVQDTNPSLAKYLRPQSAFQWWTLPYLAAMTPQYIQNLLIGALAGNHVPAYQMFDLIIDSNPEIAACIGEYIDGITEKKLIVEPYHEEDEQPTPEAIRRQKIVSAALRNMKPDPANDENALRQTIRDIAYARFIGPSVLNEDWYDTYGTGKVNTLTLKGIGTIAAPRCTYWVHPVCYAWDVTGRLGLRLPTEDLKETSKSAKTWQPGSLPTDFGQMNSLSMFGAAGATRAQSVQPFPENQFLIAIHKMKTGSALAASDLRSVAWWWCVYNFSGDWLLDLAQLFGIPFRKAKYQQGTPEAEKQEAREMLQNMGSRGWCLLDERVDVEFEKAMDQGASSPQGFLIQLAERQFRKVILRQTMTGQDTSTGKGFGSGELDVKGKCINAGAEFCCEVLREQFARHVLIVNTGDDSELPYVRMLNEKEGGPEDAARDTTLASGGLKIGVNYLRKKYNIPMPAEGEETIGGQAQPGPTAPGGGASRTGNDAAGQWKCPDCGNVFDATKEKETAMGAVACPKCAATVTQADEVEQEDAAGDFPSEKKPGVKGKPGEKKTDEPAREETDELEAHELSAAQLDAINKSVMWLEGCSAVAKLISQAELDKMKSGEEKVVANPDASHSTTYCSCGNTVRQCRCGGSPRKITIIKSGCKDCQKAMESAAAPEPRMATRTEVLSRATAQTLAEMVEPLVKYLRAAKDIADPEAQRAYLTRAIAKWPELTKPIQHDDSLQSTLTPALVETFVQSLEKNPGLSRPQTPPEK